LLKTLSQTEVRATSGSDCLILLVEQALSPAIFGLPESFSATS
jgi:hypothetical protein